MSANKTKEINNLDDFQDGIFKIERNGKIITVKVRTLVTSAVR